MGRDKVIPQHVAIIMDGNGRWAKQRGKSRIKGHEAGAESVRCVIRGCREAGVKYLTLYAFSVENWVRPEAEVRGLMKLLLRFLKKDEKDLHENGVRLRVTGRIQDLPAAVQKELNRVMDETRHYTNGQVIFALSYSGRAELVDAAKKMAEKVQNGTLKPEDITEQTLSNHMYLPDVPDPDLMIRTSGEQRLSNFLLWELAYAEFYFDPVYWPDFREAHFKKALDVYASRNRRFGDVE